MVGGSFSLLMVAKEGKLPHGGAYKTINPFSTIAFSWISPFTVEGSLVTLNFSRKDGGTDVTLTHVKFADEEARSNHEGGWKVILESLEKAFS